MFRNNFKIAWRNLLRNKAFSAINIAGLGLGVACSLLIMLWVQDERGIDGFHRNKQLLFQVYERNYYDGKVDAGYSTQGLLAEELKKVIPEVEFASATDYASSPGTGSTIEANDRFNKFNGLFAGEDFFRMFSYPLLQGQSSTALNIPNAIAISRNMAEFFFGSPDKAIGKTMRFENKKDLQVTAVFENIPSNSSVRFDFLQTWMDYVKENNWVHNWGNTSPNTYVQLRSGADPLKVEAKIKDFIYRYQQKDRSFVTELAFQPYAQRYLHSSFKNGKIAGGRIEYVKLFTMVAIFILLIACINFMNLATARSVLRAKEVGVRKVVGANRLTLIWQFMSEAMLLASLSVIIALGVMLLLLPAFNNLTGKNIELPLLQPVFWISVFALLVTTGFISGSYPALFLSSLKPVKVLKGTLKFNWREIFMRKGLVVFQFALSIILIVGMMIIYRQVNYIQSKNIGYDRENLLYVPIEGNLEKNYPLFKEEAEKIPGILAVSKMRNSPTVIEHHTGSIAWEGKDPNLTLSFADAVVGYDFVKTMKLKVKEGRDFSTDFRTDSTAYLLNEEAVKRIGYQNPVGKSVEWGNRKGTIIGVLEDFHFNSMHHAIEPLIVRLDENWSWGTILIRTKAGQTQQALTGLQHIWKDMNPKFSFTYKFSDKEFDNLYRSEQVVSKLSNYFAFLAIFISCLGLFGLATFTAGQRTKEIGVRKVLGASVGGIVRMLSKDFLKLVLIAAGIAFPVAWWAMNKWLQDFTYHTNIGWWIFAAAGMAALLIALLTVSFQAIKAAIANPVKSLRTE